MGSGVSLVSPRGTTLSICHPAHLWPSSAHNSTAEPLASPGWALTAASCILMLCCPTTVGVSEPLSALRAQQWSGLTRWSVDELAILYTLHAGVPGRYGLRCTTTWCDLMVCFFPHQCPEAV